MKQKKKLRFSLGFKTTTGIMFTAIVLSSVAIIFGYKTYKNTLESQHIQTAFNLANTIAAEIDPATIDYYLETGREDEAYRETRKHLINVQESNNIIYAVVIKPTQEGFYYIYDTDQSDEAFSLGDFQEYYPGDFLDNKQNFLSGNSIKPIITNYEFGLLLSALVPIKDSSGIMRGYVNVVLSMNEIKDMERNFLIRISGILISLMLILAIMLLAATRKILVTPINRLASATGDFVRRREQKEEADGTEAILDIPDLDTGDELGHLYRSIRQMEADIHNYIDNLTAVMAEKEPGDKLFLYTDGVVKASNDSNELYGTERMLNALNRSKEESCEIILKRVKDDIDVFAGEAPQSDDITMLSFELKPKTAYSIKKLNLIPTVNSIGRVSAFVEQELEEADIPVIVINLINFAVDEIYSDIVRYSGADDATVSVAVEKERIVVSFADNGYPYDPTKKPDPGTSLSAEERKIGGLGFYIVKKTMDTVEYEYKDGCNVLTLIKYVAV